MAGFMSTRPSASANKRHHPITQVNEPSFTVNVRGGILDKRKGRAHRGRAAQPARLTPVKKMGPTQPTLGGFPLKGRTITREIEHATLHVSGCVHRRIASRPAQESAGPG